MNETNWADVSEERPVRLIPDINAPSINHQYGGMSCLQFDGHYRVEELEPELVTKLVGLHDRNHNAICWGNQLPEAMKTELKELLGQDIAQGSEGLIRLADGSCIALENCD